ncbi:MAG TPA: ATP-grasp domain-containing protein [Candidatus Saccharimonadales bacterium]|nr:ATP-grasp domain-containing protein [Candidatus Saccharimonadales bacterium]
MKTILVSGASGIIGYGVLQSLRQAKEQYRLIGTTVYSDSVAPAFCDIFERAPLTVSPQYIDWLCGVIQKHHVDMIIPCIDVDMYTWNEHRERLAKTGANVLLNNPDLIELCGDKWEFYKKMRTIGSPYLIESRTTGTFAELQGAFGLPFLMKPKRGFGSKGIVMVDSAETFAAHEQDFGSVLMAQPIVGNDETEYTVSAFFDRDSSLRCFMSLRRKLAKEGFTEKATVASLPGVERAIQEMAAALKPVGPTNFQFRLHDGELKLLEINPRISSATSIRTAFGYNESVMAVDYFLNGKTPSQPKVRNGYAVRYTEDKIFYDSDTL